MNNNKSTTPNCRRRPRYRPSLGSAIGIYRPLLARWLLEMALSLEWYRKPAPGRLPDAIVSREFLGITGIVIDAPVDDDGEVMPNGSNAAALSEEQIADSLDARLAALRAEDPPAKLPLLANIEVLANLLGLNAAEKAIVAFAASVHSFAAYRQAIARSYEEVGTQRLAGIIARLANLAEAQVAHALQEDRTLVSTGILRLEVGTTDLEDKVGLMEGLADILLQPGMDREALISRFMQAAGGASLTPAAFHHLACDVEVTVAYLREAVSLAEPGANILFYGQPGTGKTELAKTVAQALGLRLYEVPFSQRDGRPLAGERRLRAYSLCQTVASHMDNVLLLFDEVEDVFATASGDHRPGPGGKAWINRALERNPVPTIWVTNDADIDPAYLRRFDYSVRFPVPPHGARLEMARHHFRDFAPTDAWLSAVAANEQVTPAQFERAARLARLAGSDARHACVLIERALDRSATLLGQKRISAKAAHAPEYDLGVVNTDADISRIIEGLRRRPCGTFYFYGPPGTGKSELGRHMARRIERPIILRRASDILSKWIGETERNIADMFAEAREADAVLILDEADSFLADRREARANWEVTQVNELLTQMEAHEGIFVCTTNLMERLDQASLRRFTFKVKFDYLTADQRWQLFCRELERLGGTSAAASSLEDQVRRLDLLTPGDFAVAARRLQILGEVPSAMDFHRQLRAECVAKGAPRGRIGF